MAKRDVRVEVLSGTFESQPLVFAHLLDAAPQLNMEAVEVICKQDPTRRLLHYFVPQSVDHIIDRLGLDTTVVLVFPEAGDTVGDTKLLRSLSHFPGAIIVP